MRYLVLLCIWTIIARQMARGQRLTKEQILKIPHIDNLSPTVAHIGQDLHVNITLYINEIELEEVDSEFRVYARLIWLATWRDSRLDGIQEEVLYFNKSQIWTPDIHSFNNEISESKISNHYADTISVRKNGVVEYAVFENFEFTCRLRSVSEVGCYIGLAGYFAFTYNYNQLMECNKDACFQFTEPFLKIGNESRQWTLGRTSFQRYSVNDKYSELIFFIKFNRGVNIAYYCVKYSPVILVILMLSQFMLPIHAKARFVLNGFSYILTLMMILNLQYEFFNLDLWRLRNVGAFYVAALFFTTFCWSWNVISENIWISCSHEYKPLTDSTLYKVLSSKYLSWFIPKEVVSTNSFLMKIIFVLDKVIFVVTAVCLIGVMVKVEAFLALWRK